MTWVREGVLTRCPRHGELFDATCVTCKGCDVDPGPPVGAELEAEVATPPKGCYSTHHHERELNSLARFATAAMKRCAKIGASLDLIKVTGKAMQVVELDDSQTGRMVAAIAALVAGGSSPDAAVHAVNTAVSEASRNQSIATKWAELAIKAHRAAVVLSARREDEFIVTRREARQRERDRGATH